MLTRGDQLLERIAETGDDRAASELLKEFFSGYPVSRLVKLLQSDNELAVKAGAWIASELGARAAPLLGEITLLLHHPSRYARFFALDALLTAAGTDDLEALAAAVKAIEDDDQAVRWKAINFLARATPGQLRTAAKGVSDARLAVLLEWLLDAARRADVQAVSRQLDASRRMDRLFAVAAAARLAATTLDPLIRASKSADSEINSFACEQLEDRKAQNS